MGRSADNKRRHNCTQTSPPQINRKHTTVYSIGFRFDGRHTLGQIWAMGASFYVMLRTVPRHTIHESYVFPLARLDASHRIYPSSREGHQTFTSSWMEMAGAQRTVRLAKGHDGCAAHERPHCLGDLCRLTTSAGEGEGQWKQTSWPRGCETGGGPTGLLRPDVEGKERRARRTSSH